VALDRRTAASALYYVGETVFCAREAGLFFLVEAEERVWVGLAPVVRLLGEEGLGGKRSQGYGVFTPEFVDDFSLPTAPQPRAYLVISLVYPAGAEEVRGNLVSYQLLQRTGWLESGPQNTQLLHRRVLMFAEGSVFRRPPRGQVVDVTPPQFHQHPVLRSGLAFNLGVVTA
jgi:CRISPR-associated protein Csm4